MERTLLKWVKGRPGLGNKDGWPGLRAPSEVVSAQVHTLREALHVRGADPVPDCLLQSRSVHLRR